ncbi:MAG: branched-chain amino acid aminotransferase [Spirochaetota bacterium]|nr:branched-chain amino acid aminotransferase [Spirochaetota bacterium]
MNAQTMQKVDLDWGNLPFGYVKTDYNIRYFYRDGKWSDGELFSDDNIQMHIADPCLHYGQEAFEGLKAFETVDGKIAAFRPDENAKRLQLSCERIYIPQIPIELFLDAVQRVISNNARYVPPFGTGASLYLRPLALGIGPQVGLGPAKDYLFLIFVTPVGPYYKGGFKPVNAIIVRQFDRAAPQGVGDCKVGGNYAAGLRASEFGKSNGYPVVLHLDPKENIYLEEFTTSNFVGISGNKYITPHSNTILPSITNMSLAAIAEDMGMTVERRQIKIEELEDFDEVGAVGTAAVITPVHRIHYNGNDFTFGDDSKAGPVITDLYERLTKIQTGELEDKFGWLEQIK